VTFADVPAGERIFIDANPLVYYFAPDPIHGPACSQLIARVENQEIVAVTSTHVLSEAAHHLMTLEAAALFGWQSKVVQRLKQQPGSIQKLKRFRQAIDKAVQFPFQVLGISPHLIAVAAELSQQHGLLHNDALCVAVMQAHGLINLASNDADFDRMPGLQRYAPI
jgi:predicted nucleic acid-binding protein